MPLATALLPGFDLPSTMALQQLGRADPTARLAENRFLKVFATGEGEMFYYFEARGDAVHLAVGPEGALPSPALVAAAAAPVELPPEIRSAPALRRVAAAFPGLRVLRVPWMFDVAAGAILQQRVTFAEAAAGFAKVATRYGTAGPYGLQLFPTAERLARLPGYAFQELGIDPLPRAPRASMRAKEGAPLTAGGKSQRKALDAPRSAEGFVACGRFEETYGPPTQF